MKIEDLKLDEYGNITRFSYKPEYSVKFKLLEMDMLYEIRVLHRHPDASKFTTLKDYEDFYNSRFYDNFTPVVSRAVLAAENFESMKELEFWEFLYRQIKLMEDHETKEWFKIDGLYFKNPHPYPSNSAETWKEGDERYYINDSKVWTKNFSTF